MLAWVGPFALLLTPLVGRYVSPRNIRWLSTVPFLMFALMFWLRSRFTIGDSYWDYSLPTLIQGIAMATFFIPLVAISLSGLAPNRIPSATGLSNFARITAGSFATAIYTSMWGDRAALHHEQLVSHIYAGNPVTTPVIHGMQAQGFSYEQALGVINRLLDQQAYTIAFGEWRG